MRCRHNHKEPSTSGNVTTKRLLGAILTPSPLFTQPVHVKHANMHPAAPCDGREARNGQTSTSSLMSWSTTEIWRGTSFLPPSRSIHRRAHNIQIQALASSPSQLHEPGMAELKQIGQYVLGETLGQGSFGKVKRLFSSAVTFCLQF